MKMSLEEWRKRRRERKDRFYEDMNKESLEQWLQRTLARADQSGGPNSCWVIHSCKSPYPTARIGSYRGPIIRIICTILYGPIPDGWVIRHKCDNPRCINPAHLVPGTKAANTRDIARQYGGLRPTYRERREAAIRRHKERLNNS